MNTPSENQSCPYDLAEHLESTGKLADGKKLRSFLCACCREIWDKLPEAARQGLVIAENYNKGFISTEALVAERVRLWQFWDSTPDHYNHPTLEANAVRAVICCLYETVSIRDAYESVACTMDFCNAVEAKEQEQFQLLERIFMSPKT